MKEVENQSIHSRGVMRKIKSWNSDEFMRCRYAGSYSRMTHEHRSFRRNLDSNVINREKIAATMLRHFLHWFVSLCETRERLHLHAQFLWDRVIISLRMWDCIDAARQIWEDCCQSQWGISLIESCCSNLRCDEFDSADPH